MIALIAALALASSPRFALVVGSNDGAPDRATLWFAESDADQFARTLVELGRFPAADVTVLKAPDAATVLWRLKRLIDRARDTAAAGEAPLVLFYYSGHANPSGLELGEELVPYERLSKLLAGLPAGVHVAVIDACHSGALTQVKGARPAPLTFEVQERAEGLAIITSSSAFETAQESAQLGGSFFTHHLVTGLRGAADSDRDGRVTLDEAYRYAYHRTLSATATGGVTPQHPTWSMRMAGKGEVVLVNLRDSASLLSVPAAEGRSWVLTELATQRVVAELLSGPDALELALPAGTYRVDRIRPAPRLTGTVTLGAAGVVELDEGALTIVPGPEVSTKGEEVVHIEQGPWFLGAEVSLASPVLKNFGAGYAAGVTVRRDFPRFTATLGASYAQKLIDDEWLKYTYHAATATLGLYVRFSFSRAALLVGARGGAAYAVQVFRSSSTDGLIGQVGPALGVAVPIGQSFAVRGLLGANVHAFQLNRDLVARFSLELSLALEWAP